MTAGVRVHVGCLCVCAAVSLGDTGGVCGRVCLGMSMGPGLWRRGAAEGQRCPRDSTASLADSRAPKPLAGSGSNQSRIDPYWVPFSAVLPTQGAQRGGVGADISRIHSSPTTAAPW